MSGEYSLDTVEHKAPEMTKKVMKDFEVDEETAGRIITFANTLALEKMKKWTSNMRRRVKEEAEVIYQLTKRLKRDGRADKTVVNEIEKKVLELCVSS